MHSLHLLLAQQSGGGDPAAGAAIVVLLIQLTLVVLTLAGLWATFAKAGKPGWASIIPIYNAVVLLEIAGKSLLWLLLLLIPLVNIIVAIVVSIEVAKSFRKGAGFGLGLAFLPFIFYPILGFSDARYSGPPKS